MFFNLRQDSAPLPKELQPKPWARKQTHTATDHSNYKTALKSRASKQREKSSSESKPPVLSDRNSTTIDCLVPTPSATVSEGHPEKSVEEAGVTQPHLLCELRSPPSADRVKPGKG